MYNKLYLDKIPPELSVLQKLEQILIAQGIVFEKIVVMPKGQQRKIKGAICNVPVDCERTCRALPRPRARSGIIMLRLKRKMEFRGHVYFQAVRPEFVQNALNWLQANNPLYENITIDITTIGRSLTTLQHEENSDSNKIEETECNTESSSYVQIEDLLEDTNDPLNEHRLPTNETCLHSRIPDYPAVQEGNENSLSVGNEIYDIAPGENKHPVSFMTDKQCEELAFPCLFPKGRFGFTA